MEQRRSFGYLLRRHRLAAGLTHERLAECAGLSARSISDLERGVSQRPRRDTLELLCRALQLMPPEQATMEEAARSTSPGSSDAIGPGWGPGSVPQHLTSFVGRDHELHQIRRLLRQDGLRLLTLTGPGGTGKSRLAMRIAEEVKTKLDDGACFLELAPVATADEVPRAIGRAVGVASPESAGVLAATADRIADREMLLVLDNFEHVLPAAPAIVDLLRACPRLSVLVTSRASLRLSAEYELQVPPLPVPASGQVTETAIGQYAAVQLFVERSARVRPSFALTTENAATIAAICRRLDGLPLALELAAARMKLLTPQALLQRLDGAASGSAIRLLTRGSLDAAPHQRTLLDTMLWSYNLLTPAEQRLFRWMSIFSGGCTLEAAEAVVGDPSPDTLDLIGSLLDKSLLYVDEGPDAEPRFMMLETIRELGLERLRTSGELPGVADRHAHYYLAMVEAIGPQLFASPEKLRRAAPEYHNANDALRWLFHHG